MNNASSITINEMALLKCNLEASRKVIGSVADQINSLGFLFSKLNTNELEELYGVGTTLKHLSSLLFCVAWDLQDDVIFEEEMPNLKIKSTSKMNKKICI